MRGLVAAVAAAALMACAAVPGAAAEVTRDSYREAVEPICKTNTEANERILDGVRSEVQKGKLKPAAAKFAKAARELKRTVAQLVPVPRPSADQARLSRWLDKLKAESDLFDQVGAKLRSGEKTDAQRLVVKLTTNATRANNVVIPFEFEYCRLEPARFV